MFCLSTRGILSVLALTAKASVSFSFVPGWRSRTTVRYNLLQNNQKVQIASFSSGRENVCVVAAEKDTTISEKDTQSKGDIEIGEIYSNPLTSFLGKLIPKNANDLNEGTSVQNGSSSAEIAFIDEWEKPKVTGISIDEMVALLDSGLREREWFVTGNVMPELFADDFFFKDPDVQLRGIKKYGEGVRKLFDQETSRCEVIFCALDEEATNEANGSSIHGEPKEKVKVVLVEWRLSGKVNIGPFGGLNIKPYICKSYLHVRDNDGLIVFQEDKFDIPGWDILLSAIAPWLPFLAPPAPPVSEIKGKQ